jgi:oligoendopeptidase F
MITISSSVAARRSAEQRIDMEGLRLMAMSEASEALPCWDLDSLFPGPESPELRAAIEGVTKDTAELEALFERHGVGTRTAAAVDDGLVAAFEEVVNAYNALLEDAMRIQGYLFCLVAADVRDETAQGVAGEWRQRKSGLARLAPRFTAWVGSLDVDTVIARSAVARDHAPVLRRLKIAAAKLMDPGQEDLAAALNPSGGAAWMALRDDLAGRAVARIALDGEEQELPVSEIENLAYSAERDVRRRAFAAEEAAWQVLGIPLAAALNGVKGQQLTLSTRRGWADPLDQALFDNAIDRPVLDAMLAAIWEALPDYHRHLRAKARLLGLPVLAGYDIRAPVGEPAKWPYDVARQFIVEVFTANSPGLGAVAARAFAEQWIDAETRPGKDGGAFSMPVGGNASRIFLNYLPVYDWMSALAHELGHTYHAAVVADAGRTLLQAPGEEVPSPQVYPSTLSETASTFCEALVQRAARTEATPAQEVALLDAWLQTLTLNVFGVLPYFLFEEEVFAARQQRELSAADLNELMVNARRRVTGDAVDPRTVATSSWSAPHFFIASYWYYNFPYAFGMLFALGLLAVRDAEPEQFFDRFDALLADSGMCEAADLAADFGIDLRDPAFWRTSLDVYRADVERYEVLAEELAEGK